MSSAVVTTYYQLENVKSWLKIDPSDETDDVLLMRLGQQADAAINAMIFKAANKYAKLQQKPAVPLQGAMLTQDIRDAASNMTVSLYLATRGDKDGANYYKQLAKDAVDGYIGNIEFDEEIYSDNV